MSGKVESEPITEAPFQTLCLRSFAATTLISAPVGASAAISDFKRSAKPSYKVFPLERIMVFYKSLLMQISEACIVF